MHITDALASLQQSLVWSSDESDEKARLFVGCLDATVCEVRERERPDTCAVNALPFCPRDTALSARSATA
jgi:hypothetical protein